MGAYEQRAYGVSANPIIGGVQYFHETTKPTTRPNGDALVVGDRWWKTDDGTEWFWNGTYWLSPPIFSDINTATSDYSVNFANEVGSYNLFVSSLFWCGKTPSNNSGTDYRLIKFKTFDNDAVNLEQATIISTSSMSASTYFNLEVTENRYISTDGEGQDSGTVNINLYYYRVESTGSPAASWTSLQIKYHLVAP